MSDAASIAVHAIATEPSKIAWSAAGVFGPVLVNYIRQSQIDHGIPKHQAYNVTMYIMAGLLVIAFFANLGIRPVAERYVERLEKAESRHAMA